MLMNIKPILVLILIASVFTSRGQSPIDMPHLRRVFASLEQNFTPVIGKLNETKLPDSIYTSLVHVEETEDNDIIRFAGDNYAYFATLGSNIKSKDSVLTLIKKWKDRIVPIASEYILKSEKLTKIADTHLGYEFERIDFGNKFYIIQICFYRMDGTSKYSAYISFTHTQAIID